MKSPKRGRRVHNQTEGISGVNFKTKLFRQRSSGRSGPIQRFITCPDCGVVPSPHPCRRPEG